MSPHVLTELSEVRVAAQWLQWFACGVIREGWHGMLACAQRAPFGHVM